MWVTREDQLPLRPQCVPLHLQVPIGGSNRKIKPVSFGISSSEQTRCERATSCCCRRHRRPSTNEGQLRLPEIRHWGVAQDARIWGVGQEARRATAATGVQLGHEGSTGEQQSPAIQCHGR